MGEIGPAHASSSSRTARGTAVTVEPESSNSCARLCWHAHLVSEHTRRRTGAGSGGGGRAEYLSDSHDRGIFDRKSCLQRHEHFLRVGESIRPRWLVSVTTSISPGVYPTRSNSRAVSSASDSSPSVLHAGIPSSRSASRLSNPCFSMKIEQRGSSCQLTFFLEGLVERLDLAKRLVEVGRYTATHTKEPGPASGEFGGSIGKTRKPQYSRVKKPVEAVEESLHALANIHKILMGSM